MSKTVYLKIRQLTKTDKQDVYQSDVAEVYAEKKLLPKIKSIKLATFYRTKKDRICISSMQVISAIQQLDDTLDVNNIGESDFIIDYRKNQQPVWLSVILKIIVCIIIFIGSAYAIMAYNNDVSTIEIFEKVYRITLNEAMILCILKDATERMTATNLSKSTDLSPSHTSKMLRILEEKGLIVRELGNEDRRQMYFHLSSTGKQRVSELEVDKVEMPELLKPLFK